MWLARTHILPGGASAAHTEQVTIETMTEFMYD